LKRIIVHLSVALLAFIVGLIAASFKLARHQPALRPLTVTTQSSNPVSKPAPKQITFEIQRFTDNFRHMYESSDGVIVSYAYDNLGSSTRANNELRRELEYDDEIVDRAPYLNEAGKWVGERVVTQFPVVQNRNLVIIRWTDGSHFHSIHAPTMKYALEFERWRLSTGIK
jgi:hypothetical protein